MTLVKYLQFALGIVAAGGVAIFLSGNALAADGGPVVTSQGALAEVSDGAVKPSSEPVLEAQAVADDTPVASLSGAEPAESIAETATASSPLVHETAELTASSTPIVAESEMGMPAAGNVSKDRTLSEIPGQLETTAIVAGDQTSVVGSSEVIEEPASVPPVQLSIPDIAAVPPVMLYHSRVLPIQPTITSHPTPAVADLASLMPSAAQLPQVPTPAKTNGALGRLTAVLAASVVPQPFSSQVGVPEFVAVLPVATVVILLVAFLFIVGYATRLRKAGFATAARSDIAQSRLSVASHNLSLASYASVTIPSHNSIFMAFNQGVMV